MPRGDENDAARTRQALREASAATETASKRRDVRARMIADAVLAGEAVDQPMLDEYVELVERAAEAWLYWQVAFDAWLEVTGGE